MFAVCVTFEIDPGQIETFLGLMRHQAATSLAEEPGCQRFDVWTDGAAPATVFLYEIYSDRAAFDDHLQSTHFKTFDRDVSPMIVEKSVRTYDQAIEN